jgi:hypothetical protein
MELSLYFSAVRTKSPFPRPESRGQQTKNSYPGRGDRGEVLIPFVLTLAAGTMLFFGLYLLNKLYAHKTQEHLNDFENRWNQLQLNEPE